MFGKKDDWKWLLIMFNGRTAIIAEANVRDFRKLPEAFDVRRVTQTRVDDNPDSVLERKEIIEKAQRKMNLASGTRTNHEMEKMRAKIQSDVDQEVAAIPKRDPITIPFADPLYITMEPVHSVRAAAVCSVSELPESMAALCDAMWNDRDKRKNDPAEPAPKPNLPRLVLPS